ncbi:transmembrane protein 2-like [Plakobranchus ocellatus]|uniref:Transmembrane protein 2-like n=1 Tax=Plakobranchus ocellatus TaxID=259542 RepID=A0AAV3ZA40_9GAST|nr:transmembrane protein 2-like [Plakobranchus ocellatus]
MRRHHAPLQHRAKRAYSFKQSHKILLDAQIPRLTSVTIEAGGALIWGDVDGITMESSFVMILGELHVGSEDCRFEKTGGILLYGTPETGVEDPEFGKKFIGVDAGGRLEIHGKDKLSWTKLTSTSGPATQDCGLVFDSRGSSFSTERGEGIHMTLWKKDGSLFDHALFLTEHATAAASNMRRFLTYVQDLPSGVVVGLSVFEDLGRVNDSALPWDAVYQALEMLGAKQARDIGQFEPYALVTITGNTVTRGGSPNEARFRVVQSDWESPKINLMHDVSSWQPGDKVVVASTDFEWRQAEMKTILPCPDCTNYQVKLEGEFQYTHFGEVTYGVDERAEVGLLTRNFRIEGTLRPECHGNTDKERLLCERYGRDTYGGHLKVVRHGTAHLEGFEAVHLGQQANLGSYPIHFHMCDDVTGMYVKQVSVYDSMSRCVTIHGSDGLEVAENVCYLHLGHGIFFEDGAEQNNYIHHNLVLGTLPGTLTPSDMPRDWCPFHEKDACNMLASYWITHPNNILTDNVAAGSDLQGISYSFSDVPMGLSYDRYIERGLLQPNSTRYIRVPKFENNVMHSNLKSGLWFDDRLSVGEMVDGEFIDEGGRAGISLYSARDPPTEYGARVITTFSGFGDSREGYISPHTDDGSHCAIKDSLFIGETDNTGEPYDWTRTDGFYKDMPRDQRPTHHFTRSAAAEDPEFTYSGVSFYQGPVYVENCYFHKYYNYFFNDSFTDGYGNRNVRPGSAIGFGRTNHYPSAPTSGARNIKYGFCDGANDHHYVFHGNLSTPKWEIVDGAINANFRDYDGSVTGTPNTQIVHDRPFFTGPECLSRPDWSMSVCPYNYFWLVVRGEDGVLKYPKSVQWPVFMNRDDSPNDIINMEGKLGNKYILRTNVSYTVRFNNTLGDVPNVVRLRAFYGLQQHDVIRLAICFPKTTTQFDVRSWNPRLDGRTQLPDFVNSLAELDADTTGKAFYWDQNSGYLYLKLSSDKTLERIDQMCPGDECRDVTIRRLDGGPGPAVCGDVAMPFVGEQVCTEKSESLGRKEHNKKEMRLKRPHSAKAAASYQTSPWMELARKSMGRTVKVNAAQECECRGQSGRNHMSRTEEKQRTLSPLEKFCCGLKFPMDGHVLTQP